MTTELVALRKCPWCLGRVQATCREETYFDVDPETGELEEVSAGDIANWSFYCENDHDLNERTNIYQYEKGGSK